MEPLPNWAVALSGAAIGCVVGYAAKRGRLCTFGALEDAFMARDFRRLKVLALALALAMLASQAMILAGLLPTETIRYLPGRVPVLGIALGGLLFGLGMAMVGTCAFGSLVRLGSGDLRSLTMLALFAITALAVLRGGLAGLRLDYLEGVAISLPGGIQSDLAALVGWLMGLDVRLPTAVLIGGALLFWSFSGGGIISRVRLLLSGVVLGLGVAAGWLFTGVLADDMALNVHAESLTFVSPVADTLHGLVIAGRPLWDFGIASLAGVVAGAWAASVRHDEFRWEAYDDPREMKRHMAGAALMGAGGVMAGGCTIGQGLTAGSVLALSWPVATFAMVLGARLGLAMLLEGGLMPVLGQWIRRSGPAGSVRGGHGS
jgi:uncharacterized membrane protein YedE/YeeE